jgi:hypothetical protein
MKTLPSIPFVLATLMSVALPATAAVYSDASGDFTGGVGSLDITSVDVNNDATTLTFTLTLAGDPTSTVWANYIVGISQNLFGGAGGNLNGTGGWGVNAQMSVGGMDYVLASYPGYAGYDFKTWNGSAWTTTFGTASETTSTVTIPVSLASLGLSPGNSFTFDVWSQSSGNTILDALSDGTSRTWNSNPFDTGANALTYTVQSVPEPSVMALIGLGSVLLLRRARGH